MGLELDLQDAFDRFAKRITRASIIVEGVVSEVNENYTCTVEIESTNVSGSRNKIPILNVPIKVLIGVKASVIEIPKVGSDCLIEFRDNSVQRPQLHSVNEIDKFIIQIGEKILECNKDGFVFNGGEKGAMPTNGIIDKVIALENDINNLKTAFRNWVVVPTDGGAALKAITAPWYGENMQVTQKGDLINNDIKQ